MPRKRRYLCRVKEARLSRRPSPPIAFSTLSGARRVRRGNAPKHADTGCDVPLEPKANVRAGSHHDARERCPASFRSGWQRDSLVGAAHAAADEKADRLAGWPAAALTSVHGERNLDLGATSNLISASNVVTYGTVRQRPRHYRR
jgi:hypothetical protein